MKTMNLGTLIENGTRRFLRSGTRLAALTAVLALASSGLANTGPKTLDEQVKHELLMLPYYSVFDQMSFQVNGATVTLTGSVTRPFLRTQAANVVKRLAGVTSVNNRIEVLPLSGFDDRIRVAELRAVYGNAALFRYNLGAVAPIRIIVKNGHVTLEGVVATQMDKNLAGIAANGVAGVFSVTNNLEVKS